MSIFSDFQRVWQARFPNQSLPTDWEDEVRSNLDKHQQKVQHLRDELAKEEFYVEYLERLLSDFESSRKHVRQSRVDKLPQVNRPSSVYSHDANCDDCVKPSAPQLEEIDKNENGDGNGNGNGDNSVNQCINELSFTLKNSKKNDSLQNEKDLSSFVTVIEVSDLKAKNDLKKKAAPRPPIKKLVNNHIEAEAKSTSSSLNSPIPDETEPYYDMVPPDIEAADYLNQRDKGSSSTDDKSSSSSTLPTATKYSDHGSLVSVAGCEPESPGRASDYVNIDFFIKRKLSVDNNSSDGDLDDVSTPSPLLRNISIETDEHNDHINLYGSSISLDCSTPLTNRKVSDAIGRSCHNHSNDNIDGLPGNYSKGSSAVCGGGSDDVEDHDQLSSMFKSIVANIIESETLYVDYLHLMNQHMKAIKATLTTSQPVISEDEFNTIFYKIPDLYALHNNFLETIKKRVQNHCKKIGDCFKLLASNLILYGAFLHNYGRATDTVRKCSANSSQFSEISQNIKCKFLKNQCISLEDLLHKPVARVQKNALVLHDLIKFLPNSHPDYHVLNEALEMTQAFLDEFNMIQTKSMFPANDRAQRRLIKNSFIVELVDGQRKLRHLFLFNDVIACAKYKPSRSDKYTFELKWFIPLADIVVLEESMTEPRESCPANIVSLKTQACTVRDQILEEERLVDDKKQQKNGNKSEKQKKKLCELEAQLVLASPNLVFRLKNRGTSRLQTFFLSSEFERMQWVETISALHQTCAPPTPNTSSVSMIELQAWITACRTFLKTNMGSYLLRSGREESLLVGDLYVTIKDLTNIEFPIDIYVCLEVDSYGHFFRKAKSKMICKTTNPVWNECFVIDLEGSENLRVLLYRETDSGSVAVFGKYVLKLSRSWLGLQPVDKTITMNSCLFNISVKFVPSEMTLRRVPVAKAGAIFGAKIQQVCKRQKREVPFIITSCIREVERRGMKEVGIYRVSGSSSDLTRLKKSFETNAYEAEQLLKDVDIHSVTGVLKLYLRELPEALFTDHLYQQLFEAYNSTNNNSKQRITLLQDCFSKLPLQNKQCILTILNHLIKVNEHEADNKMSLNNLATVFGPTLLRPSTKNDSHKQRDMLVAGTFDVMSQAGILFCFLDLVQQNVTLK